MKKTCFLVLLILILGLVGCKQEPEKIDFSALSITDQIAELEMQKDYFTCLETTYDDYAQIHDYLYPDQKPLKDEIVFTFMKSGEEIEIKGEELIGLNLEEQRTYISKNNDFYKNKTLVNSSHLKEISISDVYKDKTLDWYYVFLLKKLVLPEGESYIPTRYTLEKINGNYKVIEYASDRRLGVADQKVTEDFLLTSGCSTFYGEPVIYIKTNAY